jgi:hypothetical protein
MCHCGSSCNNNCKKIAFKFSTKDPNFTSQNVVVNPSNTNYISHAFVRCPIYNSKNKVMGYKVSDDYVQQVGTNKYVVRLNNTYTFLSNNKSVGSISWQYVFENTTNSIYYPPNVPAKSTVISGTGIFANAKGKVTLIPKENGDRFVYISLV